MMMITTMMRMTMTMVPKLALMITTMPNGVAANSTEVGVLILVVDFVSSVEISTSMMVEFAAEKKNKETRSRDQIYKSENWVSHT